MALVKATLKGALMGVFGAGAAGASRKQQAAGIADAYNSYAMLAQSCAMLPPSLVMYAPMKQQLEAAMSQEYMEVVQPASKWADAFQTFWTGALFGATGAVIVVPGTPALKAQLIKLFSSNNELNAFVDGFASALDSFTKLVMVQDTVLPPPTGCAGPIT